MTVDALNTVSRPTHRTPGAASVRAIKSSQGSARCLLSLFIDDDACRRVVSGVRVLCMPCRERLLAADVPTLVYDEGRQVVYVDKNEATDVDVLERIVRGR